MKVEMAIVKKGDRETRALTASRRIMVPEIWADRIERVSKGRIVRVEPVAEPERPRRRRKQASEG